MMFTQILPEGYLHSILRYIHTSMVIRIYIEYYVTYEKNNRIIKVANVMFYKWEFTFLLKLIYCIP